MALSNRSPKDGSRPDAVGALSFKLELKLPGKTIGFFEECSGIGVEVEVKEYQEGGLNTYVHRLPTRVKYGNLVLKRGITHEDALLKWFRATREQGVQGQSIDVVVSLVGPGTEPVRSWTFAGAYPVKWTGPTLSAGSTAIATETLEIAHKGLAVV